MGNMRIDDYIAEIDKIWRTGGATEHSYRGALQRLLADLMPGLSVLNEPRRIACGAPDYIIARRGLPVAFVEAKDIGDADLDGKKASGHKEQFDRYRDSLSAIAFTDYLDFHLYLDGRLAESVRIGEPRGDGIAATGDTLERFLHLVECLANAAPRKITSAPQLVRLMAGRARLLQEAASRFLRDCDPPDGISVPKTSLGKLMSDFRRVLMPDVGIDEFSDIYAQTVTYGMFAARLHDKTPADFSRFEAASLIPKSNPFLQQLFGQLALSLEDEIAWLVDSIAELFAFSDVARIMRDYGNDTARSDPMVHFYEDFLAAYDAGLRKDRGVWYTPVPVVRFMVRAVDFLLQSRFGLPDGLADASRCDVSEWKMENGKWKIGKDSEDNSQLSIFNSQLPFRVQVLDPALGTATFLAECIRQIHSRFAGNEGMWPDYVEKSLIPRLNGFELLMASYTMAHVKLDLVLQATGCGRAASRRFNVFLTDSLTPGHGGQLGKLFSLILGEEAEAASRVKRDCPVMVVIGNPPYNVSSSNKGTWIQNLVDEYKKGLRERKINLDDDYIKFIRLGQYYIDKNGSGILAYITNNSFLDGITHRQMRQSLMETFDEIFILNLHGNTRKKEFAPDGSRDDNVFDIMQGVSINIFVKRAKIFNAEAQRGREKEHTDLLTPNDVCDSKEVSGVSHEQIRVFNSTSSAPSAPPRLCVEKTSPACTIHYADLYGKRAEKFSFLESHDIESVPWQTITPKTPYFFFVPKDFSLEEEYNKGFSVSELFSCFGLGVKTERDDIAIHLSRESLRETISDFASLEVETIRSKYHLGRDSRDWSIERAKKDVLSNFDFDRFSKPMLVRCFDTRWTFYSGTSKGFIGTPAYPTMRHMLHKNIALSLIRNSRGRNAVLPFVADTLVGKDAVSSLDNCRAFPLYLYHEEMGRLVREPNLNSEIVARIEQSMQNAECRMQNDVANGEQLSNRQTVKPPNSSGVSPEQVLHYIYAVLHSPSYRERYGEFLKVDFPRIPYPKDGEEFRRLAAIGAKLVETHLMRDPPPPLTERTATFPVAGSNTVEETRFCQNRVFINPTQYFDNVPEEAWECLIGGYQPAQKWLKDRKGRALSAADLLHYKRIILALLRTIRLVAEAQLTI